MEDSNQLPAEPKAYSLDDINNMLLQGNKQTTPATPVNPTYAPIAPFVPATKVPAPSTNPAQPQVAPKAYSLEEVQSMFMQGNKPVKWTGNAAVDSFNDPSPLTEEQIIDRKAQLEYQKALGDKKDPTAKFRPKSTSVSNVRGSGVKGSTTTGDEPTVGYWTSIGHSIARSWLRGELDESYNAVSRLVNDKAQYQTNIQNATKERDKLIVDSKKNYILGADASIENYNKIILENKILSENVDKLLPAIFIKANENARSLKNYSGRSEAQKQFDEAMKDPRNDFWDALKEGTDGDGFGQTALNYLNIGTNMAGESAYQMGEAIAIHYATAGLGNYLKWAKATKNVASAVGVGAATGKDSFDSNLHDNVSQQLAALKIDPNDFKAVSEFAAKNPEKWLKMFSIAHDNAARKGVAEGAVTALAAGITGKIDARFDKFDRARSLGAAIAGKELPKESFAKAAGKAVAGTVGEMVSEGLEEGTVQLTSNLVDEKIDTKDILSAAFSGAAAGGASHGVMGAVGKVGKKIFKGKEATEEQKAMEAEVEAAKNKPVEESDQKVEPSPAYPLWQKYGDNIPESEITDDLVKAHNEWMNKYGKTHMIDGTPMTADEIDNHLDSLELENAATIAVIKQKRVPPKPSVIHPIDRKNWEAKYGKTHYDTGIPIVNSAQIKAEVEAKIEEMKKAGWKSKRPRAIKKAQAQAQAQAHEQSSSQEQPKTETQAQAKPDQPAATKQDKQDTEYPLSGIEASNEKVEPRPSITMGLIDFDKWNSRYSKTHNIDGSPKTPEQIDREQDLEEAEAQVERENRGKDLSKEVIYRMAHQLIKSGKFKSLRKRTTLAQVKSTANQAPTAQPAPAPTPAAETKPSEQALDHDFNDKNFKYQSAPVSGTVSVSGDEWRNPNNSSVKLTITDDKGKKHTINISRDGKKHIAVSNGSMVVKGQKLTAPGHRNSVGDEATGQQSQAPAPAVESKPVQETKPVETRTVEDMQDQLDSLVKSGQGDGRQAERLRARIAAVKESQAKSQPVEETTKENEQNDAADYNPDSEENITNEEDDMTEEEADAENGDINAATMANENSKNEDDYIVLPPTTRQSTESEIIDAKNKFKKVKIKDKSNEKIDLIDLQDYLYMGDLFSVIIYLDDQFDSKNAIRLNLSLEQIQKHFKHLEEDAIDEINMFKSNADKNYLKQLGVKQLGDHDNVLTSKNYAVHFIISLINWGSWGGGYKKGRFISALNSESQKLLKTENKKFIINGTKYDISIGAGNSKAFGGKNNIDKITVKINGKIETFSISEIYDEAFEYVKKFQAVAEMIEESDEIFSELLKLEKKPYKHTDKPKIIPKELKERLDNLNKRFSELYPNQAKEILKDELEHPMAPGISSITIKNFLENELETKKPNEFIAGESSINSKNVKSSKNEDSLDQKNAAVVAEEKEPADITKAREQLKKLEKSGMTFMSSRHQEQADALRRVIDQYEQGVKQKKEYDAKEKLKQEAEKEIEYPKPLSVNMSDEDRKLILESRDDPSKLEAAKEVMARYKKRLAEAELKHEEAVAEWKRKVEERAQRKQSEIDALKKEMGISKEDRQEEQRNEVSSISEAVTDTLTNIEGSKDLMKSLNGSKTKPGLIQKLEEQISAAEEAIDGGNQQALSDAVESMSALLDELNGVRDELQDKHDNTPESLQDTDAYYAREDAIESLTDAIDTIESSISNLTDSINIEEDQSTAEEEMKKGDFNLSGEEATQVKDKAEETTGDMVPDTLEPAYVAQARTQLAKLEKSGKNPQQQETLRRTIAQYEESKKSGQVEPKPEVSVQENKPKKKSKSKPKQERTGPSTIDEIRARLKENKYPKNPTEKRPETIHDDREAVSQYEEDRKLFSFDRSVNLEAVSTEALQEFARLIRERSSEITSDADGEFSALAELELDKRMSETDPNATNYGDIVADLRSLANNGVFLPTLPPEFNAEELEKFRPLFKRNQFLFRNPPGMDVKRVDGSKLKSYGTRKGRIVDRQHIIDMKAAADGMISQVAQSLTELGWTQLDPSNVSNPGDVLAELIANNDEGVIPQGGVLGATRNMDSIYKRKYTPTEPETLSNLNQFPDENTDQQDEGDGTNPYIPPEDGDTNPFSMRDNPVAPDGQVANHSDADLASRGFISKYAKENMPSGMRLTFTWGMGNLNQKVKPTQTSGYNGGMANGVIMNKGKVIARFEFDVEAGTSEYDGGVQLHYVEVTPSKRNLGLSKVIVAEIAERARRLGATNIYATVLDPKKRPIATLKSVLGNAQITESVTSEAEPGSEYAYTDEWTGRRVTDRTEVTSEIEQDKPLSLRETQENERKAAELDRRIQLNAANRYLGTLIGRRGYQGLIDRAVFEARKSGNLSEKEIQGLTSILNYIGSHFFANVKLSIEKGDINSNAMGQYDSMQKIIKIFKTAINDGVFLDTAAHEIAHHLTQFLPEADREALRKEWKDARTKFLKENPGFASLVGNDNRNWYNVRIKGTDLEAASKLFPDISKNKLFEQIPNDKPSDKNPIMYRIRATEEIYRLFSPSEWFAETFKDTVLKRLNSDPAYTGNQKTWKDKLVNLWENIKMKFRQMFGKDQAARILANFAKGRYDASKFQDVNGTNVFTEGYDVKTEEDARTIAEVDVASNIPNMYMDAENDANNEGFYNSIRDADNLDDDTVFVAPRNKQQGAIRATAEFITQSARGISSRLHRLAKNNPNSPTVKKLANLIHSRANTRSDSFERDIPTAISVKRTYFINKFQNIMGPLRDTLNSFKSSNGKTASQLREEVYKHLNDMITGRSPITAGPLGNAATELKSLLQEIRDYRVEAGEEIGFVEDYFPAVYNQESIINNRAQFVSDATAAYMIELNSLSEGELAKELGLTKEEVETGDIFENADELEQKITDLAQMKAIELYNNHVRGDASDIFDNMFSDRGSVNIENPAKSRKFSRPAQDIMRKWQVNDPFRVVQRYIIGSVKRAELIRKFGMDNTVWKNMAQQMEKDGVDYNTIKEIAEMIRVATGSDRDDRSIGWRNKSQAIIDSVTLITAASAMGKGFWNNLAEPISIGIRSGSPIVGTIRAYAETWGVFIKLATRDITGAKERGMFADSMWEQYGKDMGLIHNNLEDAWMTTHSIDAGGEDSNPRMRWLTNVIYRANLMDASETAKQRASLSIGNSYIANLANLRQGNHWFNKLVKKLNLSDKNWNPSQSVSDNLNELGIPPEKHDEFTKWVISIQNLKGKALMDQLKGNSEMAKLHQEAIVRFSYQSSVRSSKAHKPVFQNSFGGKIYMQLLSFAYSYAAEVSSRVYDMAKQAVLASPEGKRYNMVDRMRMIGPAIGAVLSIMVYRGLLEFKDWLYDTEGAKKRKKFPEWLKWFNAVSYSGLLGPVIEQAMKIGGRDMTIGGPAGSIVANTLDAGKSVIKSATGQQSGESAVRSINRAVAPIAKGAIVAGASAINPGLGAAAVQLTNTKQFNEAILPPKAEKSWFEKRN